MKKIIIIISIFVLIIIGFSIYMISIQNNGLVSNISKTEIPISKWIRFTPLDKSFGVSFPIEPRYTNRSDEVVKRDAYRVISKGMGYSINVVKYPSSLLSKFSVEENINGILEATLTPGDRITSKKEIEVGGNPAIDYNIISSMGNEKGRLIFDKNEESYIFYFISVIYTEEFNEDNYNAFINSFELIK